MAAHACLNFNFQRASNAWPFRVEGQAIELPVQGSVLTNNGETMRQLTLDGLGISRLGMFHVHADLQAGRLVELLPEFNAGDVENINVIFSNQRYTPLRVRAFIDFLVERLTPILQRTGGSAAPAAAG